MWHDVSLTGLLICILSTVSVCVLARLTWRAHRDGKRLRATVLGLSLIHELALVAYPGWYDAVTGFKAESDLGLRPSRLLVVYFGELLFILLFAGTLFIRDHGTKRCTSFQSKAGLAQQADRDHIFLEVMIVAAFALYVGQFFLPTISYETLETHYQFTPHPGLSSFIVDWGGNFVRWPGLIAAGIGLADRRVRPAIRALALITVVAEIVFSMINGLRGGVVWVASVIALAGYFKYSKKVLAVALAASIGLAPLMTWMHTYMRYVTLAAPLGTLNWQMIPELMRDALEHNIPENAAVGSNFLQAWSIRAIGPLDSIYLYKLHDEGNGGSYRPILSTVAFPIPHALWPDKPIAGSTDDSNLGMAIYRVQQQKPDNAFYDMGPILASAHAYWEGGWPFLYLAAIFTGWFWSKLLSWAERAQSEAVNIVVLTFTAALPIDGFFDMVNPLFTYFRLVWITLIPMLALIRVLDVWAQWRKAVHNPIRRFLAAQ